MRTLLNSSQTIWVNQATNDFIGFSDHDAINRIFITLTPLEHCTLQKLANELVEQYPQNKAIVDIATTCKMSGLNLLTQIIKCVDLPKEADELVNVAKQIVEPHQQRLEKIQQDVNQAIALYNEQKKALKRELEKSLKKAIA